MAPDARFQLGYIYEREQCYRTARRIRSTGGDAAGVDHVRPSQLTNRELGAIAELLSKVVPAQLYRPGPRRPVEIEKPNGGMRNLAIPTFIDRVVATRLTETLTPAIEPRFLKLSYGFRCRRSTWNLLVALKVAAERRGRWALAVCDIRKAFDSLPVPGVINSFREMFRNGTIAACSEPTQRELLDLIQLIIQGGDESRKVGIGTGCPFSPIALNVCLHVHHDLAFTDGTMKPFLTWDGEAYRYADNLIYLTRDVTEGHRVLENIGNLLLKCQLHLKEDADVFDLRERGPSLLGLEAREWEGKLVFRLHQESLDHLSVTLEKAHDSPDPPLAARQAVLGWLAYMGPAFETSRTQVLRILRVITDHGFRESIGHNELDGRWRQAYSRWRRMVQDMELGICLDGSACPDHGAFNQ